METFCQFGLLSSHFSPVCSFLKHVRVAPVVVVVTGLSSFERRPPAAPADYLLARNR
ncbi:MAG: hypothetical protein JNL79_17710 [Myxococcales bacterium]|nr:hypothetical protein [Myxococcales bacterium]